MQLCMQAEQSLLLSTQPQAGCAYDMYVSCWLGVQPELELAIPKPCDLQPHKINLCSSEGRNRTVVKFCLVS